MNHHELGILRFFSALFLLPGLMGLILSATVSTHYLEALPRMPVPAEERMTPRNIHGTVVYETAEEDQKLTWMEDVSVGVLGIGICVGLVYMRRWGIANAISAEDDSYASEGP